MSRTAHAGKGTQDQVPAPAHRRRIILLFVLAILVPVVISGVWLVVAARAVQESATRLTFSERAIADTRLYDEVLTMSAMMAAQTGDPFWVERYDLADKALTRSLATAQESASDTQVAAVLRTISANDALVAMERAALADVAAGDLTAAREILASDAYSAMKSDYAGAIEQASAAYDADAADQLALWRWLLVAQLVMTLATVAIIILLARTVSTRARRARAGVQQSMDSAVIGMALVSPDHSITYANPALCRLLGYPSQELMGKTFLELTHPADAPATISDWEALETELQDSFSRRKRYVTATGSTAWVDVAVAVVRDRLGKVQHYVEQVVDVTAEVSTHEALEHAAEQYRLLAENATDIVYRTSTDGIILWVSPAIESVLGWKPEQLVGTKAIGLVDPRDRAAIEPIRQSVYEGAEASRVKTRMVTADGSTRVVIVTARPLADADGHVLGAVVGARDVTDEEQVRGQLEASERQFRVAMQGAPIGVGLANAEGLFIETNPALCSLLGVARDDIVDRDITAWLSPADREDAATELDALRAGDVSSVEHEHRLIGATSQPWVKHSVRLVRDDDGEPYLYIHQFVDESMAHDLQAELTYRASHDVLTGLSNRGAVMNTLEKLTSDRRVRGNNVGVLFCDVDRLKPINDTHGHQAGDAVLTAVAHRMKDAVRNSDIVARIGGDEFVAVLPNVEDAHEVELLAEKLRRAVSGPVDIGGTSIDVTMSIGAAMAGPGDDPDAVLARADRSLYEAKEQGRNRSFMTI